MKEIIGIIWSLCEAFALAAVTRMKYSNDEKCMVIILEKFVIKTIWTTLEFS